MALGSQPRWTVRPADAQVGIDVGLRDYMLRVYNYMASGLALTGIVAYVAAFSGFYESIARTPLIWLVILAPLGLVMLMSFGIQRMQASTAQMVFWLYAGLMGLSLAMVFLVFTGASIARVFFITAGTFGAMSLYGYTTQRDLSQFGSFLFMGLIGIVIAGLVNIFIGSTALQFAISVIGVLVFTGLTAWDTQQIKEMYYEGDDYDPRSAGPRGPADFFAQGEINNGAENRACIDVGRSAAGRCRGRLGRYARPHRAGEVDPHRLSGRCVAILLQRQAR